MPDRDDDDLVQWVWQLYKDAQDHSSEWRDEAKESYDYRAGRQWSDEDKSELDDKQRQAVAFNRVGRTINAVVGTEINNRQEIRYLPREQGDVKPNEMLTGAAQWVRDETGAEDEESDAFGDLCTCGMGWMETRLSFDEDLDGAILMERVDPLEMYWDQSATRRNLFDMRWVMRVKPVDKAELDELWPGVDIEPNKAPWDGVDEVSRRDHVYPQDAYENSHATSGFRLREKIRVAQLQWYERETVYRVQLGPGEVEDIDQETFDRLKPQLDIAGIRYIKQKRRVAQQAFIAGGTLLESGEGPYRDGFTLHCMTGTRDRSRNVWLGLVHAMKDPQMWGNKIYSLFLDILAKNSKGGIVAERAAFDDPREVEDKWARSDSIIWTREGGVTNKKFEPKPGVQFPAGMDRLMGIAWEAVDDVTGVSPEFLGLTNKNQPGVVESQRKQSGHTILAPLFDALRQYRKGQGKALLYFIREYISDGRLIRILGKDGTEQYIPLIKDESTGRYDVIVDEAPTSANQRERVFLVLSEMLPLVAKMGIPMPPEILDYAPLPSGLVAKWKELLTQGGPQLPPEIQEEMQKLAEENKQLKSRREEALANLDLKRQEAQAEDVLDRQKAEAEIELKQAKINADYELARAKLEAEMGLKWAEAQADQDQVMQKAEATEGMSNLQEALSEASEILKRPVRRKIEVQRDANGLIESAVVTDADDIGETRGSA